ncbi:MAG: hypothetical protein ACO34J_15615 [Prochlorothrix sp.]
MAPLREHPTLAINRPGRGNPPVVALVLGRRGSARGHDPYPDIF